MRYHITNTSIGKSRRNFLQIAGAISLASCPMRYLLSAEQPRASVNQPTPAGGDAIQIGILLGTFSRGTYEARLEAAKTCGITHVQVSLDCAGQPAMPDQIPQDFAERIRREAASRGITISAMQGTFNMSHPDPAHRRTGLRQLRVIAEACSKIGTSKIHLCSGTRDRDSMWRRHADNDLPETWHDMVSCMREAANIAQQTKVILAFEPEVNNVVDSAKKARRLLDEIGSPQLKVTIDPANIFHVGELPRMKEILNETFALIGKDIALAHAKDLDHDGDAGHKAAGTGKLDYDQYISLMRKYGYKGPILLHGLSEAQVPGCVAFLREKLAKNV